MSTATISESDIRVRDAVLRQLEWDPTVDASAVGVAAKGGAVTLTGYIDSYRGKLAAERAAKHVRGVREDIAVFCPDTQAAELQALRELALVWMDRLQAFRPHVGGAVWHGIATRHSDIYMQLFCDDPKAPEWALLDHRVEYHPGTVNGWRGEPVEALTLRVRSEALAQWVLVHLMVHEHDDLRGALKPDPQGRKPRGDAACA